MKNNITVFLIDNNEIDNFIHQRVLKKFSENINVLVFSSGTETLEHLKKSNIVPHYILLSLNFPVSNSLDFPKQYEKLNLSKKDTSIYVLSTLVLPTDIEKLKRDNNYTGYVEKPLTFEKLHSIFDEQSSEIELQGK